MRADRHGWPLALILGLTLAWFAPVLFGGKVFISDNTMPAFFLPVQLWSDLLYSGFPVFADPTYANAYPVRILLSAMVPLVGKAHAYDFYVWSAYAIAAVGAYVYVFEITESAVGATVAAAAFAFSGFLQAHLGHETITHTAAWLPAVVWATHRVVLHQRGRDVAWLSLFAALSYLGNHPQITFQIGLVSVLYALVMLAEAPHRWSALVRFGAAWLLGIALVAWQIVPSWENGSLSMRGGPPTTPTLDGAEPLGQVIQLAMPWLFGGSPPSVAAPIPVFGERNFSEIANYIASPELILAAAAILAAGRRVNRLWMWIALVFFVLTLGPQTLLGEFRFFAPVFNLFNEPARDILTVHFAASVLAGMGAALLFRGDVDSATLRRAIVLGLIPSLIALLLYPMVERKAAAAGIALPNAWKNIAVVAPLAIAFGAACLLLIANRVRGTAAALLPFAAVVVGCGYFGWFAPWRLYSGSASAAIDEPPAVAAIAKLRKDSGGRVLAADGWLGPAGVSPNTSMLFDLPSIAGYGPLLPRRYAYLTHLTNSGWIKPDMLQDKNLALDLLGVRWIFPHRRPSISKPLKVKGIPWDSLPFDGYIGGACTGAPLDDDISFRLPKPMEVSRVALVTTLGCAREIPQGMVVANVVLTRNGAAEAKAPLAAGRDTAEWSVACGAQNIPGHGLGTVFDSEPRPAAGLGCVGHYYIADLAVEPVAATSMRVQWVARDFPRAFMHIKHVTVFDATGKAYPLEFADQLYVNEARWRRHELENGVEVLENLRALPAAWLVGEIALVATEEKELRAIHSGRFAQDVAFDPRRQAISSDPNAAAVTIPTSASAPGTATVESWDGASKAFLVESPAPALLVVSNRFYPGWKAKVDGEERRVLRVDGVLQGIAVPPGRHRVTLDFRPRHFAILLASGAMAALAMALLFARRAGAMDVPLRRLA